MVWPYGRMRRSAAVIKTARQSPGQSIYQLKAQGPGGTTQQQVTVNVNASQPQPPTATPVPPAPAPVINGFTICAGHGLAGRLCRPLVDHGRRHFERGLAAR